MGIEGIATALGNGVRKVGSFIGKNAGVIAGLGSTVLGGLNLGSSGGTDVFASKQLMKYQSELQRDYTQWLNENTYSQLRTGLENAGYNPLLALGVSPQQGQIGMANAVSGNTAQFSGLESAQALNVLADTDIAKFGKLGVILKNAPEFLGKTKKMFEELDIPLETIKEPVKKIIKSLDNTAKSVVSSVSASNSASRQVSNEKVFQFNNVANPRNVWTGKPIRKRNYDMPTDTYWQRVQKRFAENYVN